MASDKKYPGWLVPFGLVVAIFGAFAWLQIAAVEPYAPQAFGAGMLVFFFLKWVVGRKGFSNILPDPYSIEIIPLAFALLLLIGSSGGSDSAFFPLMYVLLLLLFFNLLQLILDLLLLFLHMMILHDLTLIKSVLNIILKLLL